MAWLETIVGVLLGATAHFPAGGNALTLPAQRHLVRIDTGNGSATWLLALQQENANGRGLSFYRSDDDARSWRFLAPIQSDPAHADRADLVAVGRDVALVYSYEGSALSGSSRHDVWFQWWRYDPAGSTFQPQPAIRVFDSLSDRTAYSRAELAIDSAGRIFVQAFRLEPDGSNTAVLAASEDGGLSFTTLPSLDNVPNRGGGRLLHLGMRLIFVYAMHNGLRPTRFRLHEDTAAPGDWGPVQPAFPEGIYHGAALSAVDDGRGGMHLVYKNENDERMYYRHFDGSQFGEATLIDSTSDWALQPAITRVERDLYIFYNHKNAPNAFDFRYRMLAGGSFSTPVVLDGSNTWKGYPASAGVLPSAGALSQIPALYGSIADLNDDRGWVTEVTVPNVTAPTCGTGTELPFADNFNRTGGLAEALGPNWTTQGLWYANNIAVADLEGENVAAENVVCCADCRADVHAVGLGAPPVTAVFLRATTPAATDRYQLALFSNGYVQLQRINGGVTTVLGEAPSELPRLTEPARLTLSVTGFSPVRLAASVNGVEKLTVTDTGADRITQPGYAGVYSQNAGVWFDDFTVQAGQ